MKRSDDHLDEMMRKSQELLNAEGALEAGSLTFCVRSVILATLPHRDPGDVPAYGRRNGGYSLVIQPGYTFEPTEQPDIGFREDYSKKEPVSLGYPYGTIPRLLLCWLTTEVIRKRSPVIELGENLSSFMTGLGLIPAGGEHGPISRLKDQLKRLFAARISCLYESQKLNGTSLRNVQVADEYIWWPPQKASTLETLKAKVVLNDRFFQELTEHPVPLDMRVVQALKQSPMALDIYMWLTYRMSYLKRKTLIPWAALELQFGSEYKRTRAFKENFKHHLAAVRLFYPQARITEDRSKGLILYPSRPQVLKSKTDNLL
jgi:hypothetical protein